MLPRVMTLERTLRAYGWCKKTIADVVAEVAKHPPPDGMTLISPDGMCVGWRDADDTKHTITIRRVDESAA